MGGREQSGDSGELPALPPGWSVTEDPDHSSWWCLWGPDDRLHDRDELRLVHRRAWHTHRAINRAAIDHAATDAGVVLPEGYDVDAVLRDGVRAHGWWWRAGRPLLDGLATWDLWMGEQTFGGFVVDGGVWSGVSTVAGGVAPSNDAAARALWDAVGSGGPMPPMPD